MFLNNVKRLIMKIQLITLIQTTLSMTSTWIRRGALHLPDKLSLIIIKPKKTFQQSFNASKFKKEEVIIHYIRIFHNQLKKQCKLKCKVASVQQLQWKYHQRTSILLVLKMLLCSKVSIMVVQRVLSAISIISLVMVV